MLRTVLASLFIVSVAYVATATGKRIRKPTSVWEVETGLEDEYDGAKLDNMRDGDVRVMPGKKGRSYDNPYANNWPDGIIPYTWGSPYTTTEKETILAGMALLTEKTGNCITFKERTDEIAYIKIVNQNGCWSYLGKAVRRGAQQLSLMRNGCVYEGIAVHEFMHALGFEHEHKRADRDSYVTIDYSNIDSSWHSQFDKGSSTSYQGTTYDYFSAMHYNGNAAAIDRSKPTIIPVASSGVLWTDLVHVATKSREDILTASDIRGLRLRYGCPLTGTIAPPTTSATTTKRRKGKG